MRLLPVALAAATTVTAPAAFMSYEEARPVVGGLRQALPEGLAGVPPSRLAETWPGWVRDRDRAVRERLRRGEQDSVVNLLFFGTSFTSVPRLTADTLARLEAKDTEAVLAKRVEDLSAALARPGGDERLALARSALGVARTRGTTTPADRRAIKQALVQALERVRGEQDAFAGELARIRGLSDPTEQLAARSTLFRERGIALDTSLRPGFAVEEALRDALERGLLTKGGVRRAAVIGPGLDFVEKQEGQDYYPPQSLQSLALADSLLRLGLSDAQTLKIAALDISPRVLDHLARARHRARAGTGYVLQLPRPRQGWGEGLVGYWRRFGDAVATPAEPAQPPATAGDLVLRAVTVRPEVVASVVPEDLDVVYQRLELPPAERFDLVVATNILVYYDTFEQCLALANVASMMPVGGLFVANTAVLELPDSRLRSVGHQTVVYSDRPEDGEHMIFYRRLPDVVR